MNRKEITLGVYMVSFFPEPLTEELLYGTISRYADFMRFGNAKEVHQELFGIRSLRAVLDLPTHISALVQNLPSGHAYSENDFIEYHTLLPYFAPFIPRERVAQIKANMKSNGGKSVHLLTGITASSVSRLSFLQYCPVCIKEDRQNVGHAYWHRVHQLPGVKICPHHHVFLEKSDISCSNRKTLHKYYVVPQFEDSHIIPIDFGNKEHRQLLRISTDSLWLLQNPVKGQDLETLNVKVRGFLDNQGWLSKGGKKIYIKELMTSFNEYFSDHLLESIGCLLGEGVCDNWLKRLVRKPKVSQHPLHYMLLLHFLGQSVSSLFNNAKREAKARSYAWPCYNKATDHFGRLTITGIENQDTNTYSCPLCGFTYIKGIKNPEKIKVIDFGPVWKKTLITLAMDCHIGLREKGRIMGVDPNTIKRYEALLNTSGETTSMPLNKPIQTKLEPKRDVNRHIWRELMKSNPSDSRTALRKRLPSVYMWLYKNDKEWLEKNQPLKQKPKATKARVNWVERDSRLKKQAEEQVITMLKKEGKPERITATAVGRGLNCLSLLTRNKDKLPETWQYIQTVSETREDYACRRVWWAVEQLCMKNRIPQEWVLVRKAGIRKDLLNKVKSTVEAALAEVSANSD